MQSIDSVNLKRYAGTWHEVAKIPNRFQNQCARGTTATYSLQPDGRIKVINACFTENGNRHEAEGVARIVDRASNALAFAVLAENGYRQEDFELSPP